jgi:hypothetical protein
MVFLRLWYRDLILLPVITAFLLIQLRQLLSLKFMLLISWHLLLIHLLLIHLILQLFMVEDVHHGVPGSDTSNLVVGEPTWLTSDFIKNHPDWDYED